MREDGSIWISGTYHSIYACGFALQREGFWILNDICWFKPNAPPNLSCRYFTASHETLLWARRSGREAHVQLPGDEMRQLERGCPEARREADAHSMEYSHPQGPGEVTRVSSHPETPCLLTRIVTACTKEGDKVLDPFTGSSTTGLAACSLGRQFVGIDTEEKYLEMSVRRYREMNASGRI
jgi:site-specific DNA-methyltransferase (adenine-specific)